LNDEDETGPKQPGFFFRAINWIFEKNFSRFSAAAARDFILSPYFHPFITLLFAFFPVIPYIPLSA